MQSPQDLLAMFDQVAAGDNASCVLSEERRLVRTNATWEQFARAHRGEQPLADLAVAHGLAKPWEHDYERFRVIAYPYGEWLLVTHAPIVEHPLDDDYRERGLIMMCVHCRRVRNTKANERWDWVPSYAAQLPERVSHGLCPICLVYYYGVPNGDA